MITCEEIKNLASLARIEVTDLEAEKLTKEVLAILDYVDQIQEVTGVIENKVSEHRNVMRDDVVTNSSGLYTEKLLSNAPSREGNYLKVKKILG